MRIRTPLQLRVRHSLRALLLAHFVVAAPVARATPPAPSGSIAAPIAEAHAAGLFRVPERPSLGTSASTGDWLVPVIVVGFTDSTMRYSAAQLQAALFDTTHASATGSVPDYFEWASRGRLRPRFEIVATVQLGRELNYYANDRWGVSYLTTPNNDWGLVRDAAEAADPVVDWRRFDRDGDSYVDMLWIIHAGVGGEGTTSMRSLWSITSRLTDGWSNGGAVELDELVPGSDRQHMRLDRFSILPELSIFQPGQMSEIGVYCHEFGHALGLPDLYDTSQLGGAANVGPGNWSLMSTGTYGGDGHSPQYPVSPGAWSMLYLGWADVVRPPRDTTLTLRPTTDGGSVVELWFQGESNTDHFLLEARNATGFDRNISAPGLLVTQVDDAMIGLRLSTNRINTGPTPGMRVVEADGDFDMARGWNHGDENDPLPGALGRARLDDDTTPSLRSLQGVVTSLAMDHVTLVPEGVQASLRVRQPGWQQPATVTDPAYSPAGGGGRGRTVALARGGIEYQVASDSRSGAPQVLLRTRDLDGNWSTPEIVTQSPVGAFEPSIALLPGDDLALAWTDLRGGQFQIWYRARISGHWTAERRLTSAATGCVSPAIAADAHGRVFVAWLQLRQTRPLLQCLAFSWASPFGTVVTVTDSLVYPTAPSLAATADGRAMIVWSDFAGVQPLAHFVRWSADSGIGPRLRLTSTSVYSQPACDVTAGADGTFHIVWQQQGSGLSEIHYQRRPALGAPAPRDTVLIHSADALQSPIVAADPIGGVHVLFERTTPLGQQLRYKHWQAVRGWDWGAATLSAEDESVAHGTLVALSPGNVNVSWQGSREGVEYLGTRLRRLDGRAALDVPDSPMPTSTGALALAPNPAYAGSTLRVLGAARGAGSTADLLDAAGRRMATARSGAAGELQFGPEVTRVLAPGLYFVRTRDGGTAGAVARVVVLR